MDIDKRKMPDRLEKKEYLGFRTFVNAALGLIVVIIIISSIYTVLVFRFYFGQESMMSGLKESLGANDEVIVKNGVVIASQSVYPASFFEQPTLSSACIFFDAEESSNINLSDNKKRIEFIEEDFLDVYFRCKGSNMGGCPTVCEISFGKELE